MKNNISITLSNAERVFLLKYINRCVEKKEREVISLSEERSLVRLYDIQGKFKRARETKDEK